MSQPALDLSIITIAEEYILRRLREHGIFVYPTSAQFPTRERIRRAILDNGIDCIIIGRNSATKKTETYAQCFERLYGEPLEPKPKRTRKC